MSTAPMLVSPFMGETASYAGVFAPWDANALARADELTKFKDSAYRSLVNTITRMASGLPRGSHVMDAGCGLGFLSKALADMGLVVTGIDPSLESIRMARALHTGADKRPPRDWLRFSAQTLENFASTERIVPVDLVVSNMVLHCVPDLPGYVSAVHQLLRDDGQFIVTIPHPDNYLPKRTDLEFEAADLDFDSVFELPFRIHGQSPHPSLVPFFHRTFASLDATMQSCGFIRTALEVPAQIGAGKSRDVAIMTFVKSSTYVSAAHRQAPSRTHGWLRRLRHSRTVSPATEQALLVKVLCSCL